jgi:sec-independent protein translocase protein TatB
MLGFSFSELLLIAVVGIVFIGPKDLPIVIRHIAKFMHELRSLYAGLKGHMDEFVKEAGMDDLHSDLKRGMTTIIDLEGKPQQAFDVKELEALSTKPASEKPMSGQ